MNFSQSGLRSRISVLALLVAGMTAIGLSSCSGKSGGGGGLKNTFLLNLGSEPPTLNPITSSDAYASIVQGYVMETLLTRHDDTYDWEPALATSWEISKDGKQYTFKLRPGVKWHDGKPVTAEDVKFSFDVIFNDKFPTAHLRPYYEGLEKVEILDPQTVRFTARDNYFKNFEIAAILTVVPKHVYGDPETGPKLSKVLIGTGPYKLASFDQGQKILLAKNADWWGRKAGGFYEKQYNFDHILMRFVKEDAVAIEMLKKGDLDFEQFSPMQYVEKATGPEWGKKVFKVKTQNSAPKGFGFIGWNLKDPKFQDKRVRLALYQLVNRDLMIEKFRYGMSVPATGPWYRYSDYASKSVKPVPFDPKGALALLKQAGWTDSDKDGVLDKVIGGKKTPLKFSILLSNKDFEKYLTIYKEDAKQAGVDIDVKLLEWNSFIKLMDERKFEALVLGWSGGTVDLDPKQIWHSASAADAGSNFISYANPEVDRLIDQGRQIMDKRERAKVFARAYELIAADVPYAFLFNDRDTLYGHTGRMKRPKDTYNYAIGTSYWSMTE